MIKTTLYILTCLTIVGTAVAGPRLKNTEPPQTYILTIDGAAHEITAGNPHKIDISGKTHQLTLNKGQTRKFNHAGVSFEFNSALHYSYEALSPQIDHWSLDGNNAVIMVQQYRVNVSFNEILQSYQDQYKQMKAATDVSDASLNIGGKNKTGKRLLVNLGEFKTDQRIYYFSDKGNVIVIVLQDTLTDAGNNTDEFRNMRELFQKTLSVKF